MPCFRICTNCTFGNEFAVETIGFLFKTVIEILLYIKRIFQYLLLTVMKSKLVSKYSLDNFHLYLSKYQFSFETLFSFLWTDEAKFWPGREQPWAPRIVCIYHRVAQILLSHGTTLHSIFIFSENPSNYDQLQLIRSRNSQRVVCNKTWKRMQAWGIVVFSVQPHVMPCHDTGKWIISWNSR